MNQIPFPDPHDADALNDWLDAYSAGEQVLPTSDMQTAALQLLALAERANPVMTNGEIAMTTQSTSAMNPPISNHTHTANAPRSGANRWHTWLSAALVATMLLSLVGYAWLSGPGGNGGWDDKNIAYAPQVASPMVGNVLDPSTSPWIADFDPADCTQSSGLRQVTIDYASMPKSDPQSYLVEGLATIDEAQEVVDQYRAMRGCTNLSDAWAYWTEARINEYQRTITDATKVELADLQRYFAGVYPQQFMAVASSINVSDEVKAEWSARAEADLVGQPIPLEAKLNPDYAVMLADGRIAFPATVMYSASDPAILQTGLPVEYPPSTVVMIFELTEGNWKYDDSLALCLANCSGGIGNPLDPNVDTWAVSMSDQVCERQPMSPDLDYGLQETVPEYADREYKPVGPPTADIATIASQTATSWYACLDHEAAASTITTYMTPLGEMNMMLLEQGSFSDPFAVAPYLRQRETESAELLMALPTLSQVAVIDAPINYRINGMTWTPMISGATENTNHWRMMESHLAPQTAMTLSDGRIFVANIPVVSLYDRGAITYEGSPSTLQTLVVVMQQHDGFWLVDEVWIAAGRTTFVLSLGHDSWWWDPAFDATPVATPAE
ncbi:MAG: hypothetical protein KC435_04070 [Thermomicrobiales bacterium]|nr:hypothetical protein [Thermomicrobiales bacterium]